MTQQYKAQIYENEKHQKEKKTLSRYCYNHLSFSQTLSSCELISTNSLKELRYIIQKNILLLGTTGQQRAPILDGVLYFYYNTMYAAIICDAIPTTNPPYISNGL